MKTLLVPDSFKGSLSAARAARAMAEGWRRIFPDAETVLLPVADGGEGTLEALVASTQGTLVPLSVTGPQGGKVTGRWGLLGDRQTAIVELAEAAGLTLVPFEQRRPGKMTTFGVGELIQDALSTTGVRRLIIGLGGSATNEGGAGLLTALGVGLLDADGEPLEPGGDALAALRTVDRSRMTIDPDSVELFIACDVDNPLIGPRGASAVFGPQKGATSEDIVRLDAALAHFACVLGIDPHLPGSGAAGGTTAGLLYLFPSAKLVPGIDLVLDAIGFEKHLENADLVLTGEGRIDVQTLGGKVVAGVGRRARAAGVPVAAIVGGIHSDIRLKELREQTGVSALLTIAPGPCSLAEAMENAEPWLADAAERAAAWYAL